MDARDLALVPLSAALEVALDLVALSRLLRAPAAVALAVGVRALDELLLDARLVLAVIIAYVIGPVAPVTADFSGIELTSSACES